METTVIGEPVKVHVIFETRALLRDTRGGIFPHHKVKPRSFVWNGHEHSIREITYVWREAIGDALVYHFAVTEGDNVFELCFNNTTMDWTLVSVAHE